MTSVVSSSSYYQKAVPKMFKLPNSRADSHTGTLALLRSGAQTATQTPIRTFVSGSANKCSSSFYFAFHFGDSGAGPMYGVTNGFIRSISGREDEGQ